LRKRKGQHTNITRARQINREIENRAEIHKNLKREREEDRQRHTRRYKA